MILLILKIMLKKITQNSFQKNIMDKIQHTNFFVARAIKFQFHGKKEIVENIFVGNVKEN